jgi:hypothetical protein
VSERPVPTSPGSRDDASLPSSSLRSDPDPVLSLAAGNPVLFSSVLSRGEPNGNLTIRRLAQRPRILSLDPDVMFALFRETSVVDHPHGIRFQLRRHAFPKTLPDWLPFPGALADELLHRLNIPLKHSRRHRLDRFPLAVEKQASNINRSPVATLAATHRIQKINKELLQPIPALVELIVVHAGRLTQTVRHSHYLT